MINVKQKQCALDVIIGSNLCWRVMLSTDTVLDHQCAIVFIEKQTVDEQESNTQTFNTQSTLGYQQMNL
jgi:hypothetical protein